jgi:hypothetical protein
VSSSPVDPKILARVRALLAKAESTDFPEEAEALTAKAHQLMARYAIDQVPHDTSGRPELHRVAVESPYPAAKFHLLGAIARANRCEAIWIKHEGVATVVGYAVDVATVELLYTSLLVQATSAMLAHGPRADVRGRSRTRAFRHSFLLAFAARIGQRLAEQTAAEEEAAAASGSGGSADGAGGGSGAALVPLLQERADEVHRAVDEAFPRLRQHRVSVSSGDGLRAGDAAAEQADLGRGRLVS